MNRKGTNAWKNETVSVFYGINRNSLKVERVSLSRDRVITRLIDRFLANSHPLGGRSARDELGTVFDLDEVIEFHPAFEPRWDDLRLKALEEKAVDMKRSRDAKDST